jgi:hypothetical protein
MQPRSWMTSRTRPRAGSMLLASMLVLAGACMSAPPGPPPSATGGGTGGAGHEPVCQPGSSQACYPGPPRTEGVGICKAGVERCRPDGSGFGPCEGAVLPQRESCGTEADDDCDGTADDPDASCVCTPGLLEACYSGPASTLGRGICKAGLRLCDTSGATWRPCEDEVTPQQETCNDDTDEDCDGIVCSAPLWGKLFGDPNVQGVASVGVDASGNVYVGGTFAGSMDLGGNVLVSTGTADVFVASFDTSGNHRWSAQFGGTGPETLNGIAVTPAGGVALAGTFYGSVSFGERTLESVNGLDSFVAKLDEAGAPVWAQRIGETADQTARSVAIDGDENVVVAGHFSGVLFCTSPPIPVCVSSAGGTDIFVRKYDPSGTVSWTRVLGDSQNQFIGGVAVDRDSDVLFTGQFNGTMSLGSEHVDNSGLGPNLFVAKLDSGGNALWMHQYGDTLRQQGNGIAVDAAGTVLVTGMYSGSLDFGPGGALSNGETPTAFAVSLTPAGEPLWARSFGVEGTHSGAAIAADAEGNVVLGGSSQGVVDLGDGPRPSASGLDAFVVKLDPGGRYIWGKLLGGASDQKVTAVAVSPIESAIVIGGSAEGTIDFGLGELAASGVDALVASFSP